MTTQTSTTATPPGLPAGTDPNSTLAAAHDFHRHGIAALPVAEDGTKRPALKHWKQFQSARPDPADFPAWFNGGTGIGVITGAVSGGLEMAEIEGRTGGTAAIQELTDVAHKIGAGDIWERVCNGWVEQSPTGGIHWFYRITDAPVPGNTKIAKLDARTVLAETRGEGGFVVTAPSHGTVHESGKPWTVLAGGPETTPEVTMEQRNAILDVLRTLDRREPAPHLDASTGADPGAFINTPGHEPPRLDGGISPLDDFEARTDWADILTGWTMVFQRDNERYWRRPGKAKGYSATTGRDPERDRLYVFSTNAGFETEKSHTKQHAYAVLHHNGDHKAAAAALMKQGFGKKADSPATRKKNSGPGGIYPDGKNLPAPAIDQIADVVAAADIEIRRVKYHWDQRIPIGSLTLMPGEEGIGKTTLGILLIAQTTRGTLPGESFGTPRDVIVIAPEDSLEDVFVPRLVEARADLTRVHFLRAAIGANQIEYDIVIPRDLDRIDAVVKDRNAAMVWIDSLVTTLADELKSISYKDVAKALKPVNAWADTARVAVVAPWHLNKSSGSETALRIMDSRAFRTAVRSMLITVADPDAPEGAAQGIIALDKANGGTLNVPALRYRIRPAHYTVQETDPETGEITEHTASCGVAEWLEAMEGDGREIARQALAPRIQQEGMPHEWLRQYLDRNGETPRPMVIAAAHDAGFSEDQIKRAAGRIRVRSSQQTGRDEKTGRPWRMAVWSLHGQNPAQSGGKSGGLDYIPSAAPTAPTGESQNPPTTSIYAGQDKSVQLVQSSGCKENPPTGRPTEKRRETIDKIRGPLCQSCNHYPDITGHADTCLDKPPQ